MITPKRLLVVEDTFAIKGRGLLLAPDVDLGEPFQQTVRVELRRPDGTTERTEALAQIPFVIPPPSRPLHHAITLPERFSKPNVPIGTEVWLLEEDHR